MTDKPITSSHGLKFFLKTGSAIALALFCLGIVGFVYGRWWLNENLSPTLERELGKTLKRPVKIGKIDEITLDNLHVRNIRIPATAGELNRLEVKELIVNFNLAQIAIDRSLKLDIRVVAPNVYLPQNAAGSWVQIPPQDKAPEGAFKIKVGTVKIEQGMVTLVPYSTTPQPIAISKIDIKAAVDDPQSQVDFKANAQFGADGQVRLEGKSLVANGQTQLTASGEKLDAAAATRIVKIPQVTIDRGTVDGSLNLAIQPQKSLNIASNLLVHDGKVTIAGVPRSLDAINGKIQVSEHDVKFDNVATKYDRVAGVVSGSLDFNNGYQLQAKTTPISLPDVAQSIGVVSPFALAGEATAQLQLTGKLNSPILAGKFVNTKISQVDRVAIDRVDGNFRLADGRIKVQANIQPKLGGMVTTQGEVQLLKTPVVNFAFRGDNIPGDSLSRLYGAKLPAQMKIGTAQVQGTVAGAAGAIYTDLRAIAPQATYPLSAAIRIDPQANVLIQDARAQVAGGNLQATGKVTRTNWDVTLQSQNLDTAQLAKTCGKSLPIGYRGKLAGTVRLQGLNNNASFDRIQASGRMGLQLAAGRIDATNFTIDRGRWQAHLNTNGLVLQSIDRKLPAAVVSGDFKLGGNNLKRIDASTIFARGRGKVAVKGGEIQSPDLAIANGQWQGIFIANDFNLSAVNPKVDGKLSGKFNLAGNLQKFTPASMRGVGSGTVKLASGKIEGTNLAIERGKWRGDVRFSSLAIASFAPNLPAQLRTAKVDGNLRVGGDLAHLDLNSINVTGDGKLNWSGGSILARAIEVKAGRWRGNFGVDRLKLASISNAVPSNLAAAQLNANFTAAGELAKFNPDRIQLVGSGELILAGGKIRANGVQLNRGNWQAMLDIAPLKLGSVNNKLAPELKTAILAGKFNVAGNINRLTPNAIRASGNASLSNIAGRNSQVRATNIQLDRGNWQALLNIDPIKLGSISNKLPLELRDSLFAGNFNVTGKVDRLNSTSIQANGLGKVSNILGGNIQIANVTLNDGKWGAKITADRLKLASIAKFAPKDSPIASQVNGELGGNIQLAGNIRDNNLAKIQISGQPILTNLRVGEFAFDPKLIGSIQGNIQGINIGFAGTKDRLSVKLDRNFQPESFDIHQQGIVASGKVVNRVLTANVEQFPIELLKQWIPKSVGIQEYRLGGIATGNVTMNLANMEIGGSQIQINNPIFGAFQGDLLQTNFRYANGQLNFTNAEIQRGKHTYIIAANIIPLAKTPTFTAKIKIPTGALEDVRDLFQIFSVNDLLTPFNQRKYATVKELYPENSQIGYQTESLSKEIDRLAELRQWLNREADRKSASDTIPELRNLHGDISGDIEIASNAKTGMSSSFDLQGQDWQLERYNLDRIKIAGNWRNNRLHLDPIDVTIKDSELKIVGDFEMGNEKAQVTLKNFPAESLMGIIKVPVDVTGGIDLNAQITGNLFNPHLSGVIALNNGQINQTKLKYAAGRFNYLDGRLNFDSNANFEDLQANEATPIRINGSIPYELPFSLKAPASNDIRVEVMLQDRGLEAIDAISKQQVNWLGGQGKVALNITGSLKPEGGFESLTAKGTGTIAHGIVKAAALPEPLQEIDGDIVFDFDRIDVKKLEGKFKSSSGPKNEAQVSVTGILPIANNALAIDPTQQLNIALKDIAIDLPTKYKGNIDGNIGIVGSALNPALTGEVKLSNGQISIPEPASTTETILGIKPVATETTPNPLQFRNLELTLGNNVQITRAPILNFLATGKLVINGTPDDIRPEGTVKLEKGSIDLFTTQFRLAGGYRQTADFYPNLGTEPILNLRLYAKALESTSTAISQSNSLARSAIGSEINERPDLYSNNLGSVRTIQVQARVAGLASQLTQRLELTSSPPRTQAEIVLLLGGGLIQQLGSGDTNIGLGIANLAGSSLLNNLQDKISEALNLTDFRLFPTITKNANGGSSNLGVAAEVGVDITPRISTSVFKILTNNELPQYGLRYRLNNRIILRGSTDLSGENRAIVEYEQRF